MTSTINWKLANIREISTKVKDVKSVRQVINIHFNFKVRPWQISAVIDITKRKRDIYAIAGISASKSLVYQSIPIITKGSVFVISLTIALIEDQVYIFPKILYNHHSHSTI